MGKAKSLMKRACSRKSIVTLSGSLLLNTKETRRRAIAQVTPVRGPGACKRVGSCSMSSTTLSTNNNRWRVRAMPGKMSQVMTARALDKKGAFLENQGMNNLTEK